MATPLRIEASGAAKSDFKRFWRAGLTPYGGDPHFVVPLLADCITRWDRKGAFFEHAEAQHWIATRGGRDVGRIAAAVDRIQDEVHGDRTGNFGWFETENEPETAHALLDTAAAWLRGRGRDRVRGPLSYTTNGISGLLVEDREPGTPVVDMAYNPPGYPRLLESWGLTKAKDLLALDMKTPEPLDPRMLRITRRVLERGRFTIRPVRTDRRGFADDVEKVLAIYNGAWAKNWGFVPMTPDEIREQAKSFKPILRPELLLFAEQDGRAVGFALSVPDVNEALIKIRGRLWPWSLVTFLSALKRVRRARTITLGVLPEFRRTGLDATLILESQIRAAAIGIRAGECSWILEDNHAMIQGIVQAGGTEYRRYRVYEKGL